MTETVTKLSEKDMQDIAEELIKLKVNKARQRVRRLDADSKMQMYRVAVLGELLTRFNLPNLGVNVTLVEIQHTEPKDDGTDKLIPEPEFVEVRVEPMA
jgi:uncharacterized hydantoinase/oxoprolinase family protein